MTFDFDTEIDRRAVPALKHHKMVLGEGGVGLFAAGVADMDFAVAPAITEALARRLGHPVFGYEAFPEDLLPALCGWMQTRHGWAPEPGQILRAPNALNALAIALVTQTAPGDGVIVQPPVFFDFFDIIREGGRRVVENPLVEADGRYEMDFEDLEAKAADPGTRLLMLCNPHNPVGRVWTRAELLRLAEICARHDVLIVSDELHGDLTFPGHPYTPFASLGPEAAAGSITILSPAKSFNIAGCCSAFTLVPDPDRRARVQTENSRLTVNKNNAFANVAMLAAYGQAGLWLDAALAYLAGNARLVTDRIGAMPSVTTRLPEGTFLMWLDFRAHELDPAALHRFLREEAGWAVTRGVSFGAQGAGFARLNIACPRARLDRALDRLAQALA